MTTRAPGSGPRIRAEDLLDRAGPNAALTALSTDRSRLGGDDLYFGARLALLAGESSEALTWLHQARSAFTAEGSMLLALRTDLGLINVLADQSQLNEGVEVALRLQSGLAAVDTGSLNPDDTELHRWLSAAAAENLGASYGLIGRHAPAVTALEEARSRYATVGSSTDLARVRGNLGIELLETGSPRRALEELRWAHQQFSDENDSWLIHRCIVAESRSLVVMGVYGEALSRLAESDRFIEDREWAENPDALRAQLARSDVEVVLNLFPEVIETGTRLQPVLRSQGMVRELAESFLQTAKAQFGLGERSRAEEAGRHAIDLFEGAGLPIKAAMARIAVARCIGGDAGRLEIDTALPVLNTSGELHGIAEAALAGADLAETADERDCYLEIADQAGALANPETAWKSLWHRSTLAQTATQADQLLDDALEVIASLRNGLTADRLSAPFLVNRRDPLESRLNSHLAAGEIDRAFALSTDYRAAALNREGGNHSAPLPASPTETTLLFQSVGNRLVCFIRAARGIKEPAPPIEMVDLGRTLGEVDDLMIDLEAQWCHLADPRLRVHTDRFRSVADKILQRLHLAVLAPIEPRLPDGPVTIVPTGRLAAVPFAALHDGTSYLIDRRLISISPGVPRNASPESVEGGVLIVGVPDQRAPRIRTEVERISEVSGGTLLLGAEATHSALAAATTIHLAGHSYFRAENPSMSAFTFADRPVTAAELCTWDLAGKTVVFASCSSGRQSNLGEDELQGLPRALLLAGANHVIMNYWDVDDESTASLMSHFHQRVNATSPAAALRSAQLATRDLFNHPFFWAASVHYRNPICTKRDPISQDVS